MKRTTVFCFVLLGLIAGACSEGQERPSIPDDKPVGEVVTIPRVLPEKALDTVIMAINQEGDQREVVARARVVARAQPLAFVEASRHRFEEVRAHPDPMARWSLAFAISELRVPEATELLKEMAQEPLPPHSHEERDHPHGTFSPRALEQMARTRALEGLRDLALEGHVEARTALNNTLNVPDTYVRSMAVQALLTSGHRHPALKEELRQRLEERDHWMIDIKPRTLSAAKGGAQ